MLNDIVAKVVGVLAIVLLIFSIGYGTAATRYAAKVAALNAQIDAADEQARLEKKRGDENAKKIKKENDNRIAAIRRYYDRMLQLVPAEAGSGPAAASATGIDGTASEQGAAGCSLEFQQACVLDANKVIGWQEYAIRNNLPIAD